MDSFKRSSALSISSTLRPVPNNSASGGYLVPADSPSPLEDQAFEDFLHDVFMSLSGLPAEAVVPRWQPEPPNQPDFGTDWVAFGIMREVGDDYLITEHNADGAGTDQTQRHETVDVLISSYGDNATRNLRLIRDGIQVEQNHAFLEAVGMGLLGTGDMLAVPAYIKDRWTRRWDMPMMIRRSIRRDYPVLSLLTSKVLLNTETLPQQTINVVQ